jgi:hypothetical protein
VTTAVTSAPTRLFPSFNDLREELAQWRDEERMRHVRNRIDMADAAAQAAVKRAIAIDNLADLEIQAANQINQSLQAAAPGNAPIIEAQADAWLVRANAYTEAVIADLTRVRAIDLADAGAKL